MAGSQATLVGSSSSALSRQLQAISAGGWANIQTPVREGFEAVEITTNGLAEQLSASREDVRRLEERLVGMEEMVRFDGSGGLRGWVWLSCLEMTLMDSNSRTYCCI